MTIAPGTLLSCSNEECGCQLQIVAPCPHGEDFRCGCGHELRPIADGPVATPGA